MSSRITFGISALVLISALSGCVVSNGEPAAVDAASSEAGEDDNSTSGPTAVIVIMINGTEAFRSGDSDASDDNGTGNTTAGNTTASGNGTASGSASPTSTAPSSPTSSPTSGTGSPSPTGNGSASPTSGTGGGANGTTGTTGNGTDNSTSNGTDNGVMVEPNVTVTFDASESEGTNLSFEWMVGNETFTNQTFDYTFNGTGAFNVTLTVTDLLNATDDESTAVVVEASGPAPGTPMGDRTETFTPSGAVAGYLVGAPNCLVSGVSEDEFEWEILGVDENGTAMKAVKLTVTASHGSAGVAHRLTLEDPAGEEIAEGSEISVEGDFVPGTYIITYRICGPLTSGGAAETTATASYVSS